MNPKLPLTSTTRILANHSGDDSRVNIVASQPVARSSQVNPVPSVLSSPAAHRPQLSSQSNCGQNVQYGALKCMRRSNTDERMSVTSLMSAQSGTSLESGCRCSQTTSESSSVTSHPMEELDDDELVDELPLPPPPVPLVSSLSSSISTLSLSNLPPPPPEFATDPVADVAECCPPDTGMPHLMDRGMPHLMDSRQVSPSSSSSSSKCSSSCQSSERSEDRSSYCSLTANEEREEDTLTRHRPVHHSHFTQFTPDPHQKSHKDQVRGSSCSRGEDYAAASTVDLMRTRNANSSDLGVRMNAAADSCFHHANHAAACTAPACQQQQFHDVQTHLLQQQQQHRHQNRHNQHVTGGNQPEGGARISCSSAKLDPSCKFKPMYSSSSSCSSCEAQHSHEDIMTAALESDATPILLNGSVQARNGGVNGCNKLPQHHLLSNQVPEKIYDSVFTYRKHADPAGAGDSSAVIASANLLPHLNEGAMQSVVNRTVTIPANEERGAMCGGTTANASYHHPPRQQLRSPMKGPLPASPADFLRNIQRVMDKKWKVAQTLSVDVNPFTGGGAPVMGFRETAIVAAIPEADPPAVSLPHPPPADNYRPTLYENIPTRVNGYPDSRPVDQTGTIVPAPFKRTKSLVPPKPPKRSESTRLSGMRADIRA